MIWRPRDLGKSPFFASVAPLLARLPADRFPAFDDLNALIEPGVVSGGGARIRFVPPAPPDKSFESQYEVRIHREGAVATRTENIHDLFNALAWSRFPRAKAELNRSHYEHLLARAGGRGPRGAARDALTLFDESGVLVASSSDALLDLLRDFQWKALFCERRAEVVAAMRVYVAGHAILEKAITPYAGLTGRALLFDVGVDFFDTPQDAQIAELDRRAAERLAAIAQPGAAAEFSPQAILGLSGWCEDNENAAYYDDTMHFRPGRTRGGAAK